MNTAPDHWEISKVLKEVKFFDDLNDPHGEIVKDISIRALEGLIEDVKHGRVDGIAILAFPPKKDKVQGVLNIAFIPNTRLSHLVSSLQAFLRDMSMRYLESIFGNRSNPNPEDLN